MADPFPFTNTHINIVEGDSTIQNYITPFHFCPNPTDDTRSSHFHKHNIYISDWSHNYFGLPKFGTVHNTKNANKE